MKCISLAPGLFALFVPIAIHAAIPEPFTPQRTEAAPGVWTTTIGQVEALTLLSAAGGSPYREGLPRMPEAGFPLDAMEIDGRNINAKTTVRLPLGGNEDIDGHAVRLAARDYRGYFKRTVVDLNPDPDYQVERHQA